MKKIIVLGGNISRAGGTERAGSIVSNGLSRRGYDVVLLSLEGGNGSFFDLDKRIKTEALFGSIGRSLYRTPLIIARVRRVLIREKADVLIVVDSMLALFTLPAVLGLQIKHICWEHFNFKSDLGRAGRRLARRLAARYCDTVVTLTERDRNFWLAGTNARASITVIPNPSPFPVQRGSLSPDDSHVVLSVGRLVQIKGYDRLLTAWEAVTRVEPTWRLRIIGDGPYEEALKRLAANAGIERTVEFLPTTPDIAKHYRDASIYCLSSRSEGFGMVLVEAACFGLPIVSFDCDTGPAEILEGTGALLVPEGDVNGLSEAMLKLIRNTRERQHISKLLLKRAESFQPDLIIEKWIDAIE